MARRKYTEIERKIMKEIAKNIRKHLEIKNWTQKELAERSGLSTSVISDYLNEKTLATPGSIQMMADALGIKKGQLDPTFKSNDDEYAFLESNIDPEKKKKILRILSELSEEEIDILILTAERFLDK